MRRLHIAALFLADHRILVERAHPDNNEGIAIGPRNDVPRKAHIGIGVRDHLITHRVGHVGRDLLLRQTNALVRLILNSDDYPTAVDHVRKCEDILHKSSARPRHGAFEFEGRSFLCTLDHCLKFVRGHTRPYWSRKLRIFLDRLGCLSFRKALASICRMRSRVTLNCCPTSSSVWSVFMPMPKRMRRTRSSRGVREARTRVTVSFKFAWIAASTGITAFLSSMKSPRWLSSSSPMGVSRLIGSLAIFITLRTFSSGMERRSASSSGVGSRPISWRIWREVRTSLLIVSIMWTGMRIVRAWSAIERVIAWRIHQVA